MVKCIQEEQYKKHIQLKTIYDIIRWNIMIDIHFFSFPWHSK